ncbi:MAG: cell division protein FtsW [Actinomycetota bacterium]|jgi:cell division protein FtsW
MTSINVEDTGGFAIPSLRERRKAALAGRRLGNRALGAETEPSRTFFAILFTVTVLVALGLVMVLSASSIVSVNTGGSAFTMFLKQVMWAFFGVIAALGTYRMPYRAWQLLNKPMAVVVVALNLMPFTGLGITVNGAHAWVEMGPVRFQPSELLKFALIIYLTNTLGRRQAELTDFHRTFKPAMFAWALAAGLAMAQRDLGAAIVLSGIAFTVLYMAGSPVRWILASAAASMVVGFGYILTSSTGISRWTAFFDIEANKEHSGYQVWQSMLSISNGGLSGVGPGAGTSKWGYVPLAHSDFIFTVIAEEFGFVGSTLVIGGFFVLTLLGFVVAMRAPDYSGALLAAGITIWFAVQAVINIGGVVGAMPVTGLTLPLISYGGSSLMITLAAAGLLLNVARKAS